MPERANQPHTYGIFIKRPLEDLGLTDQKKDGPSRKDIIVPVELVPFNTPIPPFEPPRRQPHALLAQTIRLLGQQTDKTFGDRNGIPQPKIADYGELALISRMDGSEPDLVVQFVSGRFAAREIIPVENRAELLEIVQTNYAKLYQKLQDEMAPDNPDIVVLSGPKGWATVENHRRNNERFYILSQAIQQSTNGKVRIEYLDFNLGHDNTSFLPQIIICEQTDADSIRVRAGIAEHSMVIGGHRILPVDFYVKPDGIVVKDAEVEIILADLLAHSGSLPLYSRDLINEGRIRRGIEEAISTPLYRASLLKGEDFGNTTYEDEVLTFAYEQPIRYSFEGFGQELLPDDGFSYESIRFFDAEDTRYTLKTPEEVHRSIFMTSEEAQAKEEEWKDVERWWKEEIVPNFQDWSDKQINEAAEYLRSNKRDAIELIRSKFEDNTRLVIVGTPGAPHVESLPFEVLNQIDKIDFIAFELRAPDDNTGGLKEDKEGLTRIELDNGLIEELSHDAARKKYPTRYRDPDERTQAYDVVIAEAERRGIHVLYVEKGTSWKEMNKLAAEEIANYMKENPNARGVYFSSIYSALKWSGYETEEERKTIGFSRPLSTDHIFSSDPRTQDSSVRMPAYALIEEFPGQVYTMGQFKMPTGYGQDWKNLRSAVEASILQERFAIDNLEDTPFAAQRYIFRGMVELASIPTEDLWQYFNSVAGGFFGPVEFNWDKVLDGVIIYSSEEKSPPPPTTEQMMEAAVELITDVLKDANEQEL